VNDSSGVTTTCYPSAPCVEPPKAVAPPSQPFITVQGTKFMAGCRPFYISGFNVDNIVEAAIGEVSRGGRTRGEDRACAHALGLHEKDSPWGIVAADGGQRHSTFGSASTTSACLVEALAAWGAALDETAPGWLG